MKGTKNKDVGKNTDRQISAMTPQAQTPHHVQATRITRQLQAMVVVRVGLTNKTRQHEGRKEII